MSMNLPILAPDNRFLSLPLGPELVAEGLVAEGESAFRFPISRMRATR